MPLKVIIAGGFITALATVFVIGMFLLEPVVGAFVLFAVLLAFLLAWAVYPPRPRKKQ
jgi:hypothetical protein